MIVKSLRTLILCWKDMLVLLQWLHISLAHWVTKLSTSPISLWVADLAIIVIVINNIVIIINIIILLLVPLYLAACEAWMLRWLKSIHESGMLTWLSTRSTPAWMLMPPLVLRSCSDQNILFF